MTDHVCPTTCDLHPHCFFCGGVQVDEGDRAVCTGCGNVTPIDNRKPEAVPS